MRKINYTNIVVLCLQVFITLSAPIIPDKSNPIIFFRPSKRHQQTLTTNFSDNTLFLRFSLSKNSAGLVYKQYLGIRFDEDIGNMVRLDSQLPPPNNLENKYSCKLTDENSVTYQVTSVITTSEPVTTSPLETNIAYCRFDDETNILKPGVNYILELKFSIYLSINVNILKAVGLFTATANHKEQIIIDSNPVFGSVYIGEDYSTISYKAFELDFPSGVTTTEVYPYSTFDLDIGFKINTYIPKESLLVIRYPTDTLHAAQTVISKNSDNKSTNISPYSKLALNNQNLKIGKFSDDSVLVSGFSEDFFAGRYFKLVLGGWISKDTNIGSSRDFEVWFYYKNSYNIIGYQASTFIKVIKGNVSSLSIEHPEGWDLYMGGAWPLTFSWSININIGIPTYTLIQQYNANNTSRWIFIASTCDFSDNNVDLVKNTFGDRPICYPYRNDLSFVSTIANYNGSAVFFKINTLTKDKLYNVTIWGIADVCGAESSDPTDTNTLQTTAQFAFSLTVYKTGDPTKAYDLRLSNLLASLPDISATMTPLCRNTVRGSSNSKFEVYDGIGPYLNGKAINNLNYKTQELLLYKEFTDPIFYPQLTNVGSTGQYAFNTSIAGSSTNIPTNPAGTWQPGFIYSSNSSNTLLNSYVVVRGDFYITGGNDSKNGLPSAVWYKNDSAQYSALPGKLQIILSKQWFQAGDSTTNTPFCLVSWNTYKPAEALKAANAGVTTTLLPAVIPSPVAYGSATESTNYIISGPTTTNPSTIDLVNSLLPGISANPKTYKIVSIYDPSDNLARVGKYFSFTPEASRITANILLCNFPFNDACQISFNLYTSCVKWVSNAPTVKSLLTYIEIHVQWLFGASGNTNTGINPVVRMIRFIKLFPEINAFNDLSKYSQNTSGVNFMFHYVYQGEQIFNDKVYGGVCIVEVTGTAIAIAKTTDSNTLAIWLYSFNLLDMDITDESSTYPIAPINTGIKSYGLNSSFVYTNYPGGSNSYNGISALQYINENSANDSTMTQKQITYINNILKTSYNFLMAPIILLTKATSSVVTNTSNDNLLIPVYCPYSTSASNIGYNVPTATASWFKMSSYDSINGLESILRDKNGGIMSKPATQKAALNTGVDRFYSKVLPATLRFNSYSEASDNKLYILNGNLYANSGCGVNCTSFSFFFNSSIAVDTNTLSFSYANSIYKAYYYTNSNKVFYIDQKPFTQAVLISLGRVTSPISINESSSQGDGVSTSNTVKITLQGIKRPSLDTFRNDTTGLFSTANYIAFFCSSGASSDTLMLTNLNSYTYYSKNAVFLLDYNNYTTNSKLINYRISRDNSENSIANDPASNLAIQFDNAFYTKGVIVRMSVSKDNFDSNSICGIVSNTGYNYSSQCSYTIYGDYTSLDCSIPSSSLSRINICCYNIIATNSIKISKIDFVLPTQIIENFNVINYISTKLFSTTEVNSHSLDMSTLSSDDLIPTKEATITDITYSSLQINTYSKLSFVINLPREPVRNALISINGSLSTLSTYLTTYCQAIFGGGDSFGRSWDRGDALVEGCDVNLGSTTGTIVIYLRNFIYKCGMSLSRRVLVTLYPVNTVDLNSLTTNFTVNMTTNHPGFKKNLIRNNYNFLLPKHSDVLASPIRYADRTVCGLTSITIKSEMSFKIPGDYSVYILEMDLDTNWSSLTAATLNKAVIDFPAAYYGTYGNNDHPYNIYCVYSKNRTPCKWIGEQTLLILFDTGLPIGKGKLVQVELIGIKDSKIPVNQNILCSIGTLDLRDNSTIFYVSGSGSLQTGADFPNSITTDNLIIYNDGFTSTPTTPRSNSSLTFRFALDRNLHNTYVQNGVIIPNTPIIFVYVPNEYRLGLYENLTPNSTVSEWSIVNLTIIKTTTFDPCLTSLKGNLLTIILPVTSYQININSLYFEVTISNIINPPDTVDFTERLNVVLTDSEYSICFKTFTNQNIQSFGDLPTKSIVSDWIKNSRGLAFNHSNKVWVINVVADKSDTNSSTSNNSYSDISLLLSNTIIVKAGRYTKNYFEVLMNKELALNNPSSTTLTLADNVQLFKTLNTYITVSSSKQYTDFYIGVKCLTNPGNYILKFNLSNDKDFLQMFPTQVIVDISPTYIETNFPRLGSDINIIRGEIFPINFFSSELSFEEVSYKWTADSANDSNFSIPNVVIAAGTKNGSALFTISSTTASLGNQKFTVTEPNVCFKLLDGLILRINIIDSKNQVIDNSYNFAKDFQLVKNSNNPTNSLQFSYNSKSEFIPYFLYCAVLCETNTSFATSDLMNLAYTETSLVRKAFNYVQSSSTQNLLFNSLVNGNNYQLTCLVSKKYYDGSNTTVRFNISTFKEGKNSTIINGTAVDTTQVDFPLTVTPAERSVCLKFNFTEIPNNSTKLLIKNYCQWFWSFSNNMKTGCITCVDEQNNVVNGVQDKLNADYITKTNCPSHITTSEEATSSVRRYLQQYNDNNSRINDLINIKRNLIDSTDTYLTSLSYHYEVNSTYYIICLVHNIICDLPMSLNDFSLNLKNFTDSLDTNDKLKIINSNRNELSFTNYTSINNLTNITIIDDKTVPDINQIKILSSNYSMNGTFYIELRSPEPIVCHWQINLYNKEKILMFGNKPTCYYSIMCGTIIVGPTTGGVIEHNPSYLIPFSKGVLYNVWIQCMNDIPLSQSISEPFAIMSIYQQDDCPYNNCTTSNSTSSSKGIMVRLLRISLFILLIGYFV